MTDFTSAISSPSQIGTRTAALSASSTTQALDPRGFERILAGATEGLDEAGKARAAAVDLVSIALVQPTLKLLRESSMAAAPFAPGDAEKTFGSFLDAEYATKIANASNSGLVDALTERLLNRPRPEKVDFRA